MYRGTLLQRTYKDDIDPTYVSDPGVNTVNSTLYDHW